VRKLACALFRGGLLPRPRARNGQSPKPELLEQARTPDHVDVHDYVNMDVGVIGLCQRRAKQASPNQGGSKLPHSKACHLMVMTR